MTNRMFENVFIAGGYGMIGSNVAMQIRQRFPAAAIVLAGRNPQRAEALARQLGNACAVRLDLSDRQIPDAAAGAQIIVSALPDPQNLLGEYAIRNNIAFINITSASGDDILPLLSLAKVHQTSRPVVPLGYYEAGMLLPLVALLARYFRRIDSVAMTALHDPADPLGELSSAELGHEIPPALMRKEGYWLRSDEARAIVLSDGETVSGTPFSVLDVMAVAAMTNAASVRLDVASGLSIGGRNNGQASIDLYVDMTGLDVAGQPIVKRICASDFKGQAHFTALGVVTVIEAMLDSGKGGFMLPETFIDFERALRSMREAGVIITQS